LSILILIIAGIIIIVIIIYLLDVTDHLLSFFSASSSLSDAFIACGGGEGGLDYLELIVMNGFGRRKIAQ